MRPTTSHSKTGQFALGPLKLTDIEGVLRLLPAVSAFLIFELFYLFEARARYQRVHTIVMRKFHPDLEKSDLDVLLWPASLDIAGTGGTLELGHPPKRSTLVLLRATGIVVLISVVLGTFVLETSQIWRLFARFGMRDTVTWLVTAFTLLNLLRAAAIFAIPPMRP